MSEVSDLSSDEIARLDRDDPLADRRALFDMPDTVTYLVGHSLGPLSHSALRRLQETATHDWARDLVRAWNTAGWIDLAGQVGGRLARLIGAPAGSVYVCDSVSVNLFKLAGAALPKARADCIFIESDEFPTDQYMAQGLSQISGAGFERIAPGSAADALKQGGVLIKSLVSYRTAAIADMAGLEALARQHGALIVWDLSHATGVVDIAMDRDGGRMAAGCTYKYLNGGPGAPAFVHVEPSLASSLDTPLPGWLGHAAPFEFSPDYLPAGGTARFVSGTPPILSLSALDGALDTFDGIDMSAVHAKAQALGDLCLNRAMEMGLDIQCPPPASPRGGHVSLRHEHGYAIVQALAAEGILADFRTPDTIRFGLSPLYLSYAEVNQAMDVLSDILAHRLWDRPEYQQQARVT